jgi:hypothetical protein
VRALSASLEDVAGLAEVFFLTGAAASRGLAGLRGAIAKKEQGWGWLARTKGSGESARFDLSAGAKLLPRAPHQKPSFLPVPHPRLVARLDRGAHETTMDRPLSRRELLTQSTLLLLLVPVAGQALACSTSNGASPAETEPTCNGIAETSTVADAHTHTLCVLTTDLTSPPAAGVTYTTSVSAGHSHTVALTQAQLQTIESGGSVTVMTSSPPTPHDFTISKA